MIYDLFMRFKKGKDSIELNSFKILPFFLRKLRVYGSRRLSNRHLKKKGRNLTAAPGLMGVAPGREVMTCPPCILKNHCEYSVIKLKKEVRNITSSSEIPDCGFHKCITVFFNFLFLFS